MATNLKLVTPVTPRSFLTIVKALQLDSIVVPEKGKIKRTKSKGGSPPTPTVANDGRISESNRNNTLTSMAGTMRRRGMTQVAIDAALQAENLARCKPPLDADEVSGIAVSIMRYPESGHDDLLKSLTDAGNAHRFGLRHAGEVLYVHGQ